MRRARTFGFAALVLTGAGSTLYLALHPADLLQDARTSLARGDLHAAQLDLDGFLKGHPHNPEASFQLGLVNLAQDNGASAERNLRVARDGGYDPRAIVVPLGRAYVMQHKGDEALADFTPETAPPGAAARTLAVRALAYLSLRQVPQARDAAAQALGLAPGDADAGMAAARIEFADGKLDAADAAASRVLTADPGRPETMLLRADIALARGDAAGSLQLAQTVLAASPARLDARLVAARALLVLNRDDAAIPLLDAVRHAAPRSVDARYLRAIVAVRHRDYKTADTQLAALSPVIDHLPLGEYLLAVTKLGLGQPAQAQEAVSTYAVRHPDDPAAAKLLALAELGVGKPDRAQAALRKWLDACHPDADMLNLLGRAQTMRGEVDAAARSLAAAAALAPRDTDVLNRLAAAQLGLGDVTAGAATLRQSLASAPDQPAAAETLVQTALAGGDLAAAGRDIDALRNAAGEIELVGVLTGQARVAALDFTGARHAYEDVLRRFPASRGASFGLIRLDAQTGDAPAARRRMADWMQAHPTDRDGVAYTMKTALAAGDTSAAIAAAEAAHAADPADLEFTRTLARLYLDSHQAQRAVALLERSASAGGAALLPLRAEAQARNGNPEEAKSLLLQAVDAAPRDPAPRVGLMQLRLDAHDIEGARAAVAAGLAANPGNPNLLEAAVAVELRAGGVPAGLAKAAALKADPKNLPAAASLAGDVLASRGDAAAAADAYVAALHEAPSPALAVAAATALAQSSRPTVAAGLLGEWVGAHPDDVAALRLLASLAIAARDMAGAARWLGRVLVLRPNDVVALNNSAWVKLAQGDVPAARRLAQRAYTIAPGPRTQDTLGWAIARQGDMAAALPLLEQAATAGPDQTVLYHDAFVLKAAGRADDARSAVERALSDPKPFDERNEAEALRRQLNP